MSLSLCPPTSNPSCPENAFTRYGHSPISDNDNVFIRYVKCHGSDACNQPSGNSNWLFPINMGKAIIITTNVPENEHMSLSKNIPFNLRDGVFQNLDITHDGLVVYKSSETPVNIQIRPVPVKSLSPIPTLPSPPYYGELIQLMVSADGKYIGTLTVSNLNKSAIPGGYLAVIPNSKVGTHFSPAQFVLYPAGTQYHCNGTSCVKTSFKHDDLLPFNYSSPQTTMYSRPCPNFVCGHTCKPACVNGTCDTSSGKCECSSGYYGESCQYKKCAMPCKNAGKCNTSSGTCECVDGTYGDACQYIKCNTMCTNGSECDTSTGKCKCLPSNYGDACQFTKCPGPCQNGGTCNSNTGKCICAPGFGGVVCQEIVNTCPERCINGVCDVTQGVCKCYPGYYGKSCEYSFSCKTPLQAPTGGWKAAPCDSDADCLAISNCRVEGSCLMPQSGYCKSNGVCSFGLGVGKTWNDCPN